jgi:hypothetical protein
VLPSGPAAPVSARPQLARKRLRWWRASSAAYGGLDERMPTVSSDVSVVSSRRERRV